MSGSARTIPAACGDGTGRALKPGKGALTPYPPPDVHAGGGSEGCNGVSMETGRHKNSITKGHGDTQSHRKGTLVIHTQVRIPRDIES